MDRKAIAKETLEIMRQGFYQIQKEEAGVLKEIRVDIKKDMEWSIGNSVLLTPQRGQEILERYRAMGRAEAQSEENRVRLNTQVENMSTVEAVRKLHSEGKRNIGVLNFASAKNPGGGFLNGAKAQEESLASSSTLYRTLIANEEYYRENRANQSMMYTDYAIYSPEVTFFRDERFELTENPVKASVLTLPAVNMGQVIQKGEDTGQAEKVMKRRMELALAVFADRGAKNLVLGAYGCGVFQNNPIQIAAWWRELLGETYVIYFESVFRAVLDTSRGEACIRAFEQT